MNAHRICIATSGALLTAALAALSLGACGAGEPAPEPGRRVDVSTPGLHPTDSPCDHGAPEYIDSTGQQVICGPTGPGGPEEPPPGPPGPPGCAELPGGCFPEPEPPEPPSPPEPGGGGEPPAPVVCTPANNDCTTAQACCGSNVCAFGGEREGTWCQPFESAVWDQSCVKPRAGAQLYNGPLACRELNGSEGPFLCTEMVGANCIIRNNGLCGEGIYHLHVMDLVQVDRSSCKN